VWRQGVFPAASFVCPAVGLCGVPPVPGRAPSCGPASCSQRSSARRLPKAYSLGRARMLALPASDGPRQSHAASLTAEGRCARDVARRSLLPLLVVPAWTLLASPAPSAAGNEFTFFHEFESILRQCAPMIAEVRRAGGRMLYR
jgi:hypothetical protein